MRVALIIVLSVVAARFFWLAGMEQGRADIQSEAYSSAIESVQTDMAKHCTCWFTGSKCKTRNPTVICTKPEWMK